MFLPPEGAHFNITTFGPAVLYHRNEEYLNTDTITERPIATPDCAFALSSRRGEFFDIQRTNRNFTMLIENYGYRVCVVEVKEDEVVVQPNFRAKNTEVVQTFTATSPVAMTGDFVLRLRQSKLVRRVDFHYKKHAWISMFIFRDRILTIRPNGDHFAELLHDLCVDAGEWANKKRTEGVQPKALDFGLKKSPAKEAETLPKLRPLTASTSQAVGSVPSFALVRPQTAIPANTKNAERKKIDDSDLLKLLKADHGIQFVGSACTEAHTTAEEKTKTEHSLGLNRTVTHAPGEPPKVVIKNTMPEEQKEAKKSSVSGAVGGTVMEESVRRALAELVRQMENMRMVSEYFGAGGQNEAGGKSQDDQANE